MLYTVRFNIVKYMSSEYKSSFGFYYIYIQYIDLILVALLQNDQKARHVQNNQTNFFCFAEYTIFTESTQATNWWQKFLCCYFLLRCHP